MIIIKFNGKWYYVQLCGLIDGRKIRASWPIDAQLIGVGNMQNGFFIKAAYILPPGDINNYPFDDFLKPVNIPDGIDRKKISSCADLCDNRQKSDEEKNCYMTSVSGNKTYYKGKIESDPTTGLCYIAFGGGDRFYLNLTGKEIDHPSSLNPTTRFLHRYVFLEGDASTDSDGNTRLKGKYQETFFGLDSEPIQLEGTFDLMRINSQPFEQQPYVFMQNGQQNNTNKSNIELGFRLIFYDLKVLFYRPDLSILSKPFCF